mmetsp:Transcript_30132/g.56308  ORF Transcript_30132/g.56308 Transcript_30132/m.56308 type:complete len:88 (+) Transcript_30132:56-319(+)
MVRLFDPDPQGNAGSIRTEKAQEDPARSVLVRRADDAAHGVGAPRTDVKARTSCKHTPRTHAFFIIERSTDPSLRGEGFLCIYFSRK